VREKWPVVPYAGSGDEAPEARLSTVPARELPAPEDLLRHGPAAAILRTGLPLALGLASHAAINLVNLLFVGRLGADAVQAAHVASTWNFLPMILGNCVSTSLLSRLSRRLGAGDCTGARQLHLRAEWFMLWFGVVVAAVSTLPAVWMVAATRLAGATADDAVGYLVVSNLGCLPMFVLMQTTAAMRAAGEVAVPLAILVLANVVNLLLDLLLMFGWDAVSVPAFGVVGAAYASGIARSLAAGFALVWLLRRRHPLSLRGVPPGHGIAVARPLLHDSWPQVVQIGLRAGLVLALTVVVQHRFGNAATVAIGITTRLDTLVLFASLGFANAATVYSGRAVAAGRERLARAAGWWAALQAGALGVVAIVALQSCATGVVGVFLPAASPEVLAVTTRWFDTAMWAQVLSAIALGAIGAVHGAGRMKAPLVVDLIGFGVAFPVLVVAGSHGLDALFVALVVGMGVVAALHLAFVSFGRWPVAP